MLLHILPAIGEESTNWQNSYLQQIIKMCSNMILSQRPININQIPNHATNRMIGYYFKNILINFTFNFQNAIL